MIKVERIQTAGKEHTCDECGEKILVGQHYHRIAQFESWAAVGHPEAAFSNLSDPYVQQQFWKKIVGSPEVLILKIHAKKRECSVDERVG